MAVLQDLMPNETALSAESHEGAQLTADYSTSLADMQTAVGSSFATPINDPEGLG